MVVSRYPLPFWVLFGRVDLFIQKSGNLAFLLDVQERGFWTEKLRMCDYCLKDVILVVL